MRAYLDLLQERDSRQTPGDPAEGGTGGSEDDSGPGGSSGPEPPASDPAGTGGRAHADPPPSVAALVTITVPAETLQGLSETPGEVGGFGLLDAPDIRDVVAAASRHPRTRWCVTALNPDGTAAAHGCATGRHPPPGFASIKMIPIARGPCDHTQAEIGYHPSRRLQHLIRARSTTCTAPGCSRPAARCDLDHTHPWNQGGPTCECNLAPLRDRDHWSPL